jgi:beta-galactosidase/beta-glucuronidase
MPIDLITHAGEELLKSKETPWTVYPRPQMKRDSYLNLNGLWDFAVGDGGYDSQIRVPFCPESILSGIDAHFDEGCSLFYRKKFTLPEGFDRGRVLLHVGAADQKAEVFLNNVRVGKHSGGYESFTLDITGALWEENELVIVCTDDLRDKQ